MSNTCYGKMVVVARSARTIERLEKILAFKDDKFFIGGCFGCRPETDVVFDERSRLYHQKFDIEAKYDCIRMFTCGDSPDISLLLRYEGMPGRSDYRPVYGTAHMTDLQYLVRNLHFGCEVYADEFMAGFSEHIVLGESGYFFLKYGEMALDEDNGHLTNDEFYGLEGYGEFMPPTDIYNSKKGILNDGGDTEVQAAARQSDA